MEMSVEDVKRLIIEGAARIGTEGNGLPLLTFAALAQHVLDNLVCYRPQWRKDALQRQDVDYLARMLQAVFAELQDAPMEIK